MSNRSPLFSRSDSYQALLEGLKQRIRTTQLRAAIAVNQEVLSQGFQGHGSAIKGVSLIGRYAALP
jgi:hypothetical protein